MAGDPKAPKRNIALVGTTTAEPATTIVDTGAAQARAAMEKGMEQMTKQAETFFKAAEEAAEFGRGNIEAMTKVTQTLAMGMQDIGKQMFAVTQALSDHAMESAK